MPSAPVHNRLALSSRAGLKSALASSTAITGVAVALLVSTLPTPVQAQQAGLLLSVPNADDDTISLLSTNADGSLSSAGTISVGASPQFTAMRADQAYTYVSNSNGNTISVVDTATNTVVQSIGANTPTGMAFSPDGTRFYVSERSSNRVSYFDVDDVSGQLTLGGTISTGTSPYGVVASPDGGRLYVANRGSNSVSILDAATNSVISTLNVGASPYNLAVSPDGSRLYVANFDSDSVSVVNTSTLSVVSTVGTDNSPFDVAASGDGNYYYAVTFMGDNVEGYDTATNSDVGTWPAGNFATSVTISPDSSTLYASYRPNEVRAFSIDPATGQLTLLGDTAVGSTPYFMSMCGDGDGLLASGRTFVANSAGALGCTGTSADFTGGTLKANANGLDLSQDMTLGGAGGSVDTDGNDTTISGHISGAGGFTKNGAGTLTLGGANSYTGDTAVNAGTLKAAVADALGGDSAVTLAAGAALDLNDFDQSIGSLAGAGNVSLGTATLTVGGDNSSTTYSGVLSGNGKLVKTGGGTLILGGANSHTGGTTISGGTLVGDTTTLTGDITNNAALTFAQGFDDTFTGDITGSGSLVKTGAGTLKLTGANSYTGDTTVSGGALVVASASLSGDVTNNAVLTFDQAADGTFTGGIGGSGMLTKTGGGTLTLSGTNNYSGGTTVSQGRLVVSTASLPGDVTNNAALTFAQGVDGTFSGEISGDGSLTKTGDGALTLAGANSYTGGTTISAGTLVANTATLPGDVVNNAALTFDQAADGIFAGNISGTGVLTKTGGGTLRLAGTNSHTGGTTVSEGALVGDTTSLTGDIVNNAMLTFDQATDDTFNGDITGTGSITKTGAGMLTFGVESRLGVASLEVQAGHVAINGDGSEIAVTVADGASLGGSGAFGGLVLADGAVLAPGNSIGTLEIAGDITFSADTLYLVEVDAAGNSDSIIAHGTATLDGTVQVLAAAGEYAPETSYTILTADAVSGQFESVSSNFAFLSPSLGYDGSAVTLTLARNDVSFAGAAVTANQRAAAGAAEQAFAQGNGFYDAVISGSVEEARATFDLISGELHGAVIGSMVDEASNLRRAVLERHTQTGAPGTELWVRFLGDWSDRKGDANAADVDGASHGFLAGAERELGAHAGLGVVAGYTDGHTELVARASRADMSTAHLGVYGHVTTGNVAFKAGLTHGIVDVDTRRTVSFGGFGEQLRGRYDASVTQAFGELSSRVTYEAGMVEPYAGLAAAWVGKDSFTETGGTVALTDRGRNQNFAWSTLGLRGGQSLGGDMPVTLKGNVAWQHALDAASTEAVLAFANSGDFDITAAPFSRDSLLFDVGLDWAVHSATTLSLAYGGETGKSRTSHAVKVGFNIGF